MNDPIILFDLPSGNVMTDFATEREAWAALCGWVCDEGVAAIADLSLLRIQDGEPSVIAMEDDLVRCVTGDLHSDAVSGEARR